MDIFTELDKEFHFTLDAAADASNTKCTAYFTKEDDALKNEWGHHTVWLNPPGAEDPTPWIEKAIHATAYGATVVVLIRPGLNTPWFSLCVEYGTLRFIIGPEYVCAECGQRLELCIVEFRPPT